AAHGPAARLRSRASRGAGTTEDAMATRTRTAHDAKGVTTPDAGKKPAVQLKKITLLIQYAKDPMKSLAFYRDVLGMKVVEESPQWVQLDGGGVHLALHAHEKLPAPRGVAHPWVVFEVDDPHAAYEALKSEGVAFRGPPVEVCGDEKTVGLSADFEDPD